MTGAAVHRDRPAFEVRVGGGAIDAATARDVVAIDVHEEVGRHGRATLLVQNWDPDSRTVRHGDCGQFAPGVDIAVALGYEASLATVFDGVVVGLTVLCRRGAHPLLKVAARARSILLDHPARSRQFDDVSDLDVATRIAADYGLQVDGEPGVTRPFVVSDRSTDWELLRARAADLGWVVYVRGDRLVLRPPAAPSDPVALEYGHNIVELSLTQDLTAAIGAAVGAGWDPWAVEAVESNRAASAAGLDHGDRPGPDAAVAAAGWPLREARRASPAVADAAEADARAVGAQRAAVLAHVHGTAVVAGDPALRCDSWITIAGIGTRYAGPQYVTAARHRLSSAGYLTEVQVGSPPPLRPPPVPAPPAGAPVLGIVRDLADPAGLNRICVELPWRADGGTGVWARQAGVDAGAGYGAVFAPAVGQEVLVGFVDGDPGTPVVLGALYNGKAAPPVPVDNKNEVRAVVSPDGHAVRLADGSASAASIASGRGSVLRLDDANDEVVLEHAGSGNKITLSGDGIRVTVARGDLVLGCFAGDVALDAVGIGATASGSVRLEASATVDVRAAGPLGLKGALITIN